jgi:hypothetical protein
MKLPSKEMTNRVAESLGTSWCESSSLQEHNTTDAATRSSSEMQSEKMGGCALSHVFCFGQPSHRNAYIRQPGLDVETHIEVLKKLGGAVSFT